MPEDNEVLQLFPSIAREIVEAAASRRAFRDPRFVEERERVVNHSLHAGTPIPGGRGGAIGGAPAGGMPPGPADTGGRSTPVLTA